MPHLDMRYCYIYFSLLAFFFIFCGGSAIYGQKAYKKEIKDYRKANAAALLANEKGPLDKKGVRQLRFYKPNIHFQVWADFTPTPEAKPFDMPTYSGELQSYITFGKAKFEIDGQIYELNIYRNLRQIRMPMFRNNLFLPFKDQTNDKGTYGGGRYINIKTSDIVDGKVLIDFNKAYNPYCAYSDGYVCPIPPAENHLPLRIPAGEKDFK